MSRQKTIGQYVRSRRLQAGWSFRDLSVVSGLTPTLIFNIEKGITDPRFLHLEKIADGFGESLVEFLRQYYSRTKR